MTNLEKQPYQQALDIKINDKFDFSIYVDGPNHDAVEMLKKAVTKAGVMSFSMSLVLKAVARAFCCHLCFNIKSKVSMIVYILIVMWSKTLVLSC